MPRWAKPLQNHHDAAIFYQSVWESVSNLKKVRYAPKARSFKLNHDNPMLEHSVEDCMKKYMIIALLGACIGITACDEDSAPSSPGKVSSLCEGTGGTLDGGACVCSGEKCADAKWCDSNGKCGSSSTKPDICADCPNTSPGTSECPKCECQDPAKPCNCEPCPTCTTSCEECPNNCDACGPKCEQCTGACDECGPKCDECPNDCSKCSSPTPEPACKNNDKGIGQCKDIENCENSVCKANASCAGSEKCGECRNYETRCENDKDGKGVIYTCREGAWVKVKTCGDVSCLALAECKDEDKPCTHIDEPICGECQEGAFKCEDGNVPEDTTYFDYYGEKFTIPKGFITGMRSKCVNGKWKKLDLDDPENCFYGHLKREQYPTYKLGTKDIVTVFGYDSNGHTNDREYRVSACREDGINCGECYYSFSYCSDKTSLTCRKGKVEESTCPSGGMCATSNSCFPANTTAYCTADSCQNCKSICNWN